MNNISIRSAVKAHVTLSILLHCCRILCRLARRFLPGFPGSATAVFVPTVLIAPLLAGCICFGHISNRIDMLAAEAANLQSPATSREDFP